MNGFKYNAQMGEIKPLNLVNTPKEVFDMMEFIIKQMEIIAGINSVVRGDVPTNLRSGSALALVAAQAMQFSSGLQESYVNLTEDCSTGIIELLGNPAFVQDSRVALIAGKVNQPLLKQFVVWRSCAHFSRASRTGESVGGHHSGPRTNGRNAYSERPYQKQRAIPHGDADRNA
jgi:hypothetical protein